MINEMEKNKTMSKMSDLEFDKNSVEMMRYRDNKLPYSLGFGGLAFSVLAAFIILNSMYPSTVQVIIVIFLNIFILLFGFLNVEKTKAYSRTGATTLIVLGGINVAQIFWLPLTIIVTYNKWMDMADGTEKSQYQSDNVAEILTDSNANSIHWLSTSGNFRGILAIVLLAISAAFLIVAGVIGIQKSNKLNKYLESLKVEKK